jgi:hypothetical protein
MKKIAPGALFWLSPSIFVGSLVKKSMCPTCIKSGLFPGVCFDWNVADGALH